MKSLGVLFIVAAGVLWWFNRSPATPQPAPAPAIQIPAELAASLASLDVPASDKRIWGGLLAGLGRFILADGKTKSPVLLTVADIERLRDAAVRAPVEPVAGGDKLGPLLAKHLAALGDPAARLDEPGRRQSAADLFIGTGGVLASAR
jgi:hypothetical protein